MLFERRRAAVLPGDLVELGALFVTDEGPVDLDETEHCVAVRQRGLLVATGMPGERTTDECVRGAARALGLPVFPTLGVRVDY